MKSIYHIIHDNFLLVLRQVLPKDVPCDDALIRPTSDRKFGDYQSNVCMGLAKILKKSPRDLAQDLVNGLQLKDVCDKIEIAGPGFINLHIKNECLEKRLLELKDDPRLGIDSAVVPIKHVIDFSSPNLAKEMHVGHLRTTITGEAISRVIEFMGHPVERVNHVGDWGTQFGMLLAYLVENHPEVLKSPEKFAINDLELFYKAAKEKFDSEEKFANLSRAMVVKLQSGDASVVKLWKVFVHESLRHCHEIYETLDVALNDIGESFYNDRLPVVVEELKQKGLGVEDDNAICVFLDGFENREGKPLPFIIQKSDGGYNYNTTDLAALKYRIEECHAKRLIYVTDLRQSQHFEMLFALARKTGWATHEVELSHIGYGMVLGPDRRPFKTRDGGTVQLKSLIEESINRAEKNVEQNQGKKFDKDQIRSISKRVGLAAIKYADLCHGLASDYVFSWDKMLAMEGNTGPYMLYAYARVKSIVRKSGIKWEDIPKRPVCHLEHQTEIALAKSILSFGDVIWTVQKELKPNLLTDYLYNLSKTFSSFYDKKQGVLVLDAPRPELRDSRLFLCFLTANVLKLGLSLLGIDVVEEM